MNQLYSTFLSDTKVKHKFHYLNPNVHPIHRPQIPGIDWCTSLFVKYYSLKYSVSIADNMFLCYRYKSRAGSRSWIRLPNVFFTYATRSNLHHSKPLFIRTSDKLNYLVDRYHRTSIALWKISSRSFNSNSKIDMIEPFWCRCELWYFN